MPKSNFTELPPTAFSGQQLLLRFFELPAHPAPSRGRAITLPETTPPRETQAATPRSSTSGYVASPRVASLSGDAQQTRLRLAARLARPLARLHWTNNQSTLVSVRVVDLAGESALVVRLHRCFVEAPDEVLAAIADFVGKRLNRSLRRAALATIRHFHELAANSSEPAPAATRARRRSPLLQRGEHFDLQEVFDALNRERFAASVRAEIGWGAPLAACRPRHGLQLGSFQAGEKRIRIHRALDHHAVPRLVVCSVVFHEMLHAVLPPELRGGRRLVHGPAFRARELEYPGTLPAEAWIAANLRRLVRRVRSSRKH